jgi:uncharacterized membrane protein
MKTGKNNVNRLTGMAILFATVVVLQMVASFIKFGPFSVTLALIPIIIGAAMYGRRAGALLGGAFGAIVLVMCINGVDVGGHMLWAASPVITALLCLLKGIAAGWGAGAVFTVLARKDRFAGIFGASFVCPVINTGFFLAAMALFYRDTLVLWAGDTNILFYTLIGLTGVNFLLELGLNVVLAPAVMRVMIAVNKNA